MYLNFCINTLKILTILYMYITCIACSYNKIDDKALPELELPNVFEKEDGPRLYTSLKQSINKVESNVWYKAFNDSNLNDLMEEGKLANYDILTAMMNINRAQANIGIVRSALLPSIDLDINANRTKNNKEISNSSIAGIVTKDYTASAVVNYQIDLWGAIAKADKQLQAELLEMQHNKDAVTLTMEANVAKAYFNANALKEQIDTINELIRVQKQIYEIDKAAYKIGALDTISLEQTYSQLLSTQQLLQPITQQYEIQINTMNILIGHNPKSYSPIPLSNFMKMATPKIIELDTPSNILLNRPDVKASEQKLIAANASVDIARTAYFPQITLGAILGFASSGISNLFIGKAYQSELTAALQGPIWNFGRTKSEVEVAKVDQAQAILDYKNTVRIAFTEVLNALTALKESDITLQQAQRNFTIKQDMLKMAQKNYSLGYSDYHYVLDNTSELIQAKLNYINNRLQTLLNTIDLILAVGGNLETV